MTHQCRLQNFAVTVTVHYFRMYLTCTAIPDLTCKHATCNAEGFKHSAQIQQVDQYPVCRTHLTCFSSTGLETPPCVRSLIETKTIQKGSKRPLHISDIFSSQNKLDQLIEAPKSVNKTQNESKETDCHAAIHTSIIDVPLTLYFGRKI